MEQLADVRGFDDEQRFRRMAEGRTLRREGRRTGGRCAQGCKCRGAAERFPSQACLLPCASPDLGGALAEGLLDPLEGISKAHRGEPGKRRAEPDRKLPLGRLIVETDAPVDHEPGGAAQAESESGPRSAGERREGVGAGDIGGEGGGGGHSI